MHALESRHRYLNTHGQKTWQRVKCPPWICTEPGVVDLEGTLSPRELWEITPVPLLQSKDDAAGTA